jgi:hypothetical protein
LRKSRHVLPHNVFNKRRGRVLARVIVTRVGAAKGGGFEKRSVIGATI